MWLYNNLITYNLRSFSKGSFFSIQIVWKLTFLANIINKLVEIFSIFKWYT